MHTKKHNPRLRLAIALLLLLSISGSRVFAQAGPGDRDRDGVPDSSDLCISVPGPASNNGCPIKDAERDNVPDDQDQCPNDNGPSSLGGCPGSDRDGDGSRDENDRCPDQGGPDWNGGCPNDNNTQPEVTPTTRDGDGDGVPDSQDDCPGAAGAARTNGCNLPELPKDGDCVVATKGTGRVNIRQMPSGASTIVGHILPENIYPVQGQLETEEDKFYSVSDGWVAGRVIRTGGDCEEKPPQQACLASNLPDGAPTDGEKPCEPEIPVGDPVQCDGKKQVVYQDFNQDGTNDSIEGAEAGAPPLVTVRDGKTGEPLLSFFAFAPIFLGGVHATMGDVNGDGYLDIAVAGGAGGAPQVKVFSGKTLTLLANFMAYSPSFSGGVYVAVGDLNGDGAGEIVTGAGQGAGPHVKVFDGKTFAVNASFFAYEPAFTGGVRVAAGDVNGECGGEIITGAGPGGGPHVKVFTGMTQTVLGDFFAFSPTFDKGVDVGLSDLNNDAQNDILASVEQDDTKTLNKGFDGKQFTEIASFLS